MSTGSPSGHCTGALGGNKAPQKEIFAQDQLENVVVFYPSWFCSQASWRLCVLCAMEMFYTINK